MNLKLNKNYNENRSSGDPAATPAREPRLQRGVQDAARHQESCDLVLNLSDIVNANIESLHEEHTIATIYGPLST